MFKFNSGNGATICDFCRKIIKVGFPKEEERDEVTLCSPRCIKAFDDKMVNTIIDFNGSESDSDDL